MVGNDNHYSIIHIDLLLYLYTCMIYDYAATQFDPDSRFTMVALRELEGFGVINLKNLESYNKQLNDAIGIETTDLTYHSLSSLLEMWIQGRASLDPTWRHFFWALRETQLNHFANQIESYLKGVVAEQETSSNLDPNPDRDGSETEGEGECCGKYGATFLHVHFTLFNVNFIIMPIQIVWYRASIIQSLVIWNLDCPISAGSSIRLIRNMFVLLLCACTCYIEAAVDESAFFCVYSNGI